MLNKYDLSEFLIPIQRQKVEITEYGLATPSLLDQYFPGLFSKDGKMKKRIHHSIDED